MTPAPQSSLTFAAGVEALRRIEEQRQAREERMRNALEILAVERPRDSTRGVDFPRYVRAVAREGLGRE